MPSRTIRPTQAPEPAPFAYTVGTAEGLTPEAVFVEWDGSGAGGDFLPCVSYYDNDGNLLDRAFPDSGPVTAGDTAQVSYRPFKRGGGGGASLETTNGITTISPTKELLIGSGLVLFDFGGGIAFLEADTTTVEWVQADVLGPHTNVGGNIAAPGAVVPLQNAVGSGFDLSQQAVGKLIAQVDGLYQVNVSGAQVTSGAGTPTMMRALAPVASFQMESGALIPGSVGPVALVSGSALMHLQVGDALTFVIGNNTGANAVITQGLSPEFQAFRVRTQ